MEYALIILSTVLFGAQFIALNAYQDKNGKSFRSIFLFTSIFALTGLIVFASLTGFHIGFSWYTLLFASIAAVIQIILQIVGIKALALGRVEVYSLFNVTGGMSIAYIFGITYFHEEIKPFHLVGLGMIIIALIIPLFFKDKDNKKSNWLFYVLCVLVFLANGFFGSINKIHIVSGEGLLVKEYMFYMYSVMFIISIITYGTLTLIKRKEKENLYKPQAFLFALLYGLLNSFGMFLQYAFADKIPASILFPLSNGGCIVFALIIGCIVYKKKPKLQDIIQFVIALSAMALFVI